MEALIMNIRTRIWTLGLLAVIALTACGPAATPPIAPTEPLSAATALPPSVQTETPVAAAETLQAPTSTPLLVVTPRGDQLEATDPSQVNLASGKPVLVEFIRYT